MNRYVEDSEIPVRSISFATGNISVKPQETEAQCQLGILRLGLRGYEPKSTMQEKISSDKVFSALKPYYI